MKLSFYSKGHIIYQKIVTTELKGMNCGMIVCLESVEGQRTKHCYLPEAWEEFTRKVTCYLLVGLKDGTDLLKDTSP